MRLGLMGWVLSFSVVLIVLCGYPLVGFLLALFNLGLNEYRRSIERVR